MPTPTNKQISMYDAQQLLQLLERLQKQGISIDGINFKKVLPQLRSQALPNVELTGVKFLGGKYTIYLTHKDGVSMDEKTRLTLFVVPDGLTTNYIWWGHTDEYILGSGETIELEGTIPVPVPPGYSLYILGSISGRGRGKILNLVVPQA